MFFRGLQRLAHVTVARSSIASRQLPFAWKRQASTVTHPPSNLGFPFTFHQNAETSVTDAVAQHMARLRPFSAPPAPVQQPMISPVADGETLYMTSVLRKRRLKMNKHKHKKLRKRTRALRKRLGK
ncbi:uncharacterized protein BYT42DRAFT_583754 [Radiomyces spectabilis]|uniref:uncharacterized protein n=1 Tax=Radiomyces spectabilis TaxID=64574 RepID=UPI0022206DCB|nr:uncharacterized protein BYT42DRAFT_583754 [Radiomyces spectabilis]KAI8369272.1 hypothetical protein BYT42DRAFT_583754 [Radiomyces spectabilis]